MKKRAAMFLVVVIIGAAMTNCSKNSSGLTIKEGILMIGAEISSQSMEHWGVDGKALMGLDIDMGRAIAEKMGLEVEFVDTAWNGIFEGVETNRYDCIMSSITITPERLIAHNFSKPYIGNAISIVSLKNSSIKPCNPQELSGLGVAYQAETASKFFIEKLVESGLKYIPFEYDKMTSCFDELLLNRVDVIATDSVAALEYTKKQNSQFEITWLGEPYQFFGICIKKGNDALTEAINKALDELFAEGTMLKFSMNNLNVDMVSSVRQ